MKNRNNIKTQTTQYMKNILNPASVWKCPPNGFSALQKQSQLLHLNYRAYLDGSRGDLREPQ